MEYIISLVMMYVAFPLWAFIISFLLVKIFIYPRIYVINFLIIAPTTAIFFILGCFGWIIIPSMVGFFILLWAHLLALKKRKSMNLGRALLGTQMVIIGILFLGLIPASLNISEDIRNMVTLGETSCKIKYPEKVIQAYIMETLYTKKMDGFSVEDEKCLDNFNPAGAELEKKLKKQKQNALLNEKQKSNNSSGEKSTLNTEESFNDSDLKTIDGVEIKKKDEKE
jgi:hypothetical protein